MHVIPALGRLIQKYLWDSLDSQPAWSACLVRSRPVRDPDLHMHTHVCMHILRRLRETGCESEVRLGCLTEPCLKKNVLNTPLSIDCQICPLALFCFKTWTLAANAVLRGCELFTCDALCRRRTIRIRLELLDHLCFQSKFPASWPSRSHNKLSHNKLSHKPLPLLAETASHHTFFVFLDCMPWIVSRKKALFL